ncbi:MAG: 16S rRNA (cytosine(1402)-N(4))-methyltransferase RsmH [Eubacterium sp.]|nr:16S rRNA (cytosine(1402)-N(4))-methyltransferase RsmH [Eubacterium sp.]
MEFHHIPIMLDRVIEELKIRPNGVYVDGTVGGAGHSSEILKRLSDKGTLVAIDQDRDAVDTARKRLADISDRATVVKSNFVNFDIVLDDLGIGSVDGVLLDLGVSSYQFDQADRGFSYRFDAPLDMRMDQTQEETAADIVNEYSEEDLVRILREYGEEPFARRIAANICREREKKPIRTTFELNELIKSSIPASARRDGGHPSKQTYQAIRIALNKELQILEDSIDQMIHRLSSGGRLCIITFHSLEDRIVKNAMRVAEKPCICPPDFPVCVCGRIPLGKVITRKPIVPDEEELRGNPRAKSAKLRIFERK